MVHVIDQILFYFVYDIVCPMNSDVFLALASSSWLITSMCTTDETDWKVKKNFNSIAMQLCVWLLYSVIAT